MILIKILSLILISPSLYVGNKLMKKKDVNFFDLLIIFNTLYFVIIPLKSNESVYNSIGNISPNTSIFVFFYLLFFFSALIISSKLVKNHTDSPINVTYYLKKYPNLEASLVLKLILIILPIFSLTYYVPHMSTIAAFEEIREAGTKVSYEQSSMVKFFGTIFKLGLIVPVVIFFQNLRDKKVDLLIICSLVFFLINFLILPRRELLEFFLFGGVVLYSINRELINKKLLLYTLCLASFIYLVYFPFYNVIRRTSVSFDKSAPISSIKKIYDYGLNTYSEGNERASELTDNRAIGLYRALYWLAENDTDNKISWGAITLSAIDHATPKVINPSKGLGSEHLLEKRMQTSKDSADSVLLLSLADYSMLGSIFTVLIYFLIFQLWYWISRTSDLLWGQTITSLYVVYFLFSVSFSIEQKLDGILANTVAYVLVVSLIVLIHKFNLLQILTTKQNKKQL
ncbi:hypothetical protein D9O36_07070 [Zobellia amurskyensis]|uniref:Oligosaccharide repeat unit polymerase n=1 Tax=Zobellia amurskyensis TaxID=248905 RepID=A0A7X2ZSJ4_9FLAO|nr:hypothetical protein [Zobellia amurskyensis]MUH35595.1 hypothetical protein [Zobellia amurskyensis]